MAQVVKCLPSKCQVLKFNPNTIHTRTKNFPVFQCTSVLLHNSYLIYINPKLHTGMYILQNTEAHISVNLEKRIQRYGLLSTSVWLSKLNIIGTVFTERKNLNKKNILKVWSISVPQSLPTSSLFSVCV
jgi:hypothetical protein